MTGDVGGESMHPDQHAIAFVPGNPDKFFVGSDGGLIRTSGKWADASSQCDNRGLDGDRTSTYCKRVAEPDPERARRHERRARDAADVQHLGQPVQAGQRGDGRARRTTARSSSPARRTWYLPLTGDGGDSGFDAVDPHFRFHTYTSGQMDVNYNDDDPTSWLWIGDRFIVNFPEAIRFYPPTISDPFITKTIFVGAQRVWRTPNAGGDRAFLEAHCNTAIGEFPSDLLFTGACGVGGRLAAARTSTLTGRGVRRRPTKGGSTLTSLSPRAGRRDDVGGHRRRPRSGLEERRTPPTRRR